MGESRRRMMTEVHQPPYDSKIEFLESTGEQYIDTGIIPDNDTGIQIVYYTSRYNYLNENDFFIVGLRNNTSNTRWCIGKSGTEKVAFYYGYGIYNHAPNQNRYDNKYIISLNYKNNKLFEVKDVAANNQTQQRTLSNLPFTPQYNIRLFGGAGVDANYTKASGRLFSVIISQGDKIIMNLIPVRVGNTGYMYDKISKQLFGNNGTGSFVLGADKH